MIEQVMAVEARVDNLFQLMEPDQRQFWESCYPDGMTFQDIANELSDMAGMIDNFTKVVYEVTGGQLSKPNYPASVVISEYQQNLNRITFEYANEHANDMLEAAAAICEAEGASHESIDNATEIRALKTK